MEEKYFVNLRDKYLVYLCSGIGSVFDSQVLELLRTINENDVFGKIFLLLGISSEKEKKEFLKRQISAKIVVIYFKSYPNYFFFNFLQRKSIREAITNLNCYLSSLIFHSRGELLAWHLKKIIDPKYHGNIIPDIRGASIEEVEGYFELGFLKTKLKIVNYRRVPKSLEKFRNISVVSGALKNYLIDKFKIDSDKIKIIPCLAGIQYYYDVNVRNKKRKDLNLKEEDFLILFSSGGTANWQNIDVLFLLAEKGLKILNLSKNEIRHHNVINKFVGYSEMPSYLNAADAAIIWRDKSIVNKVASPVKFSEYVCCGLPVIANNSVNMIAEYIKKHNCGLVIDSFDELKARAIQDLKQNDRNKISKEGISNFGVGTIVDKYLRFYSSVDCL